MATTERGLLMLSLRLMLMPTTMADTAMVLAMLDTLLPMVATPTTERGLLMPSPRLMPTMELMAMASPMPDMAMLLPTPMVPTPMPTDMASKKSTISDQSRPPSTNAEAQKQTKNLKFDIQCHYKSFVNLSRNWSRA